jgi:hypothetical protein
MDQESASTRRAKRIKELEVRHLDSDSAPWYTPDTPAADTVQVELASLRNPPIKKEKRLEELSRTTRDNPIDLTADE